MSASMPASSSSSTLSVTSIAPIHKMNRLNRIKQAFGKNNRNDGPGCLNVLIVDAEALDGNANTPKDPLAIGCVLAKYTPKASGASDWTLVDVVQFVNNPLSEKDAAAANSKIGDPSSSVPAEQPPPTAFWHQNVDVWNYFCFGVKKISSQDMAKILHNYINLVHEHVPNLCLVVDDPEHDSAEVSAFLKRHGFTGMNYFKQTRKHVHDSRSLIRGVVMMLDPHKFLDFSQSGAVDTLKQLWNEKRQQLATEIHEKIPAEKESGSWPELLDFGKQFRAMVSGDIFLVKMRRHLPVVDAFQTAINFFQTRDLVRFHTHEMEQLRMMSMGQESEYDPESTGGQDLQQQYWKSPQQQPPVFHYQPLPPQHWSPYPHSHYLHQNHHFAAPFYTSVPMGFAPQVSTTLSPSLQQYVMMPAPSLSQQQQQQPQQHKQQPQQQQQQQPMTIVLVTDPQTMSTPSSTTKPLSSEQPQSSTTTIHVPQDVSEVLTINTTETTTTKTTTTIPSPC
jgi:hypothetical protein